MTYPVCKSYFIQQIYGSLSYLFFTAKLQRYHHIFKCCKCGHQLKILENKSDILITDARPFVFVKVIQFYIVQLNNSIGWPVQAGTQPQQCCFTTRGWSYY